MTTTTVARWYPNQPPQLPGETADAYTNRLLGTGGHTYPYDHQRGRQCSIGYHNECSDRTNSGVFTGEGCQCPHHWWVALAGSKVNEWNEQHPVGTVVTLPEAPDEPPTRTTGPAEVVHRHGLDWPMVPLEGFDHPVEMAWLVVTA